ncbi:MAG TPA: hypothetical protein VFT04_02335 [Gemmatimonadales bacterium]|nr:hypothetical protein [Gemmatimonadales bacterium]
MPWLVLALLLLAGFIGWRLATKPVLVVVNALVLPANLRVNGGETLLLAPGDSIEQPLLRDEPNTLLWEMRRPLTRGGVPVGAGLGASLVLEAPEGRVRHVLRAMRGDTALFAPLITNATGLPLLVRVNAGLAGAEECPCEVPPASRRAPIGYYRLFQNSAVEVRDSLGRRATFRNLGPEADPLSGAVRLRFEAGDLR